MLFETINKKTLKQKVEASTLKGGSQTYLEHSNMLPRVCYKKVFYLFLKH